MEAVGVKSLDDNGNGSLRAGRDGIGGVRAVPCVRIGRTTPIAFIWAARV